MIIREESYEMQIITKEEQMMHFVTVNLPHIVELIKPYKQQRDALLQKEDGLFHHDISKQYDKIIKSVVAVFMTKHLQIDAFDAILFLDEMDTSLL